MSEETLTMRYAIEPTLLQEQQFLSHVGAVRFAYNWALRTVYANWDNVKEGTETDYIKTSMRFLRDRLNSEKDEIAPWYKENSKDAFACGIARASNAFDRYYKKVSKPPRYKKRGDDESITFDNKPRKLVGNRHFMLPRIGTVRLHENHRKARWLVKQGARVTSCTVRYAQTRWFLSITFRVSPELFVQFNNQRTRTDKKKLVGLDKGITSTIVSSDGLVIVNEKAYEKGLKKLKRAQRSLSRKKSYNKKTGEAPSKRYEKQRRIVAKHHARIKNIEDDTSHKLSKYLVDNYETIVIEGLDIASMIKNRRLSRSIAHAMWGKLKTQLTYKSHYYGSTTYVLDKWYPSSKTCSNCGRVRAKLYLHERDYVCFGHDCHLIIDRDYNASLNIAQAYEKMVAQSRGETLNGHGGQVREYNLLNACTGEVSSFLIPR